MLPAPLNRRPCGARFDHPEDKVSLFCESVYIDGCPNFGLPKIDQLRRVPPMMVDNRVLFGYVFPQLLFYFLCCHGTMCSEGKKNFDTLSFYAAFSSSLINKGRIFLTAWTSIVINKNQHLVAAFQDCRKGGESIGERGLPR